MKRLESIEDLERDPEAFGFCTFKQFVKNRDYWRERRVGRKDEEVASIDAGDPNLGCVQRYYMNCLTSGVIRLDCLEDGEKIAADMGLDFYKDFLVRPQIRKDITLRQGYYNEVTFVPKVRRVA